MKELFTAIAAVQADCERPTKNASNPHFKSKFADLAHVLEVLNPQLARHGLAVVQTPVTFEKNAGVHTRLLHVSGQEMDCGVCAMPLERTGPQAVGSAITYARRYSLMAIFCLAAEDDDAESAEGRGRQPAAKRTKTLDDVAGELPLEEQLRAVGIEYDGADAPKAPQGSDPTVPSGEFQGKSLEQVPFSYLLQVFKTAKIATNKAWAEYLLKAHVYAERNG